GKEEPDIARNSAGKIDDARRQVEPARAQVALPAQVDLRGLAAQRPRPFRIRRIDRPPAVAAQQPGKAQELELGLAAGSGLARLLDEPVPLGIGNMGADEPLRLLLFVHPVLLPVPRALAR